MFIKTFASLESTLQNLEVVEVKIANVKNSDYKIINTLVVPLTSTPLSEQCVSIAKNQYDHLEILNLVILLIENSNAMQTLSLVQIIIGTFYPAI